VRCLQDLHADTLERTPPGPPGSPGRRPADVRAGLLVRKDKPAAAGLSQDEPEGSSEDMSAGVATDTSAGVATERPVGLAQDTRAGD
jgi:hypothetical protein